MFTEGIEEGLVIRKIHNFEETEMNNKFLTTLQY
jgi:hypothetical protein